MTPPRGDPHGAMNQAFPERYLLVSIKVERENSPHCTARTQLLRSRLSSRSVVSWRIPSPSLLLGSFRVARRIPCRLPVRNVPPVDTSGELRVLGFEFESGDFWYLKGERPNYLKNDFCRILHLNRGKIGGKEAPKKFLNDNRMDLVQECCAV